MLGAVVGMLAAVAPACGGPVKCTSGCVDAVSNTCRSGNELSFCGTSGNKCQACGLGQTCNLGTCTFAGQGGGTANGGGTTSNGGGTTNNGGGTTNNGGGTTNNGGGTTNNGGGTTNNGGGTANNGGGTANNGGGTANNGGGTADLCSDGCFAGTICLRNGNNTTAGNCGTGGTNCVNCAAVSQTCIAATHTCSGATTGGGTGSNGGGTGSNGGGTGSNGGGTGSTGGGTGAVVVGTPCTSSGQCSALGSGAYCKTQTTAQAGVYPAASPTPYSSGFCTLPCASGCPGGTICAGGASSIPMLYNETETFCARSCTTSGSTAGCVTPNFACYNAMTSVFSTPQMACWDGAQTFDPPFTGGGSPTKLGTACTADTDCANSPDLLLADCFTETGANSQPTGFPGGYCTANSDRAPTNEWCGPDAVEIGFQLADGGTTYRCTKRCPNPGQGRGTLRSGYTCYKTRAVDGGFNPWGVMYGACDAPGNDCTYAPGSTCNTTNGYCCFADGGCDD